jgi:hypothetical protein
MKMKMTKITLLIAGLVLANFWPATTRAQAEVSPDNYKRVPVTPVPPVQPSFQGNFSLSYPVGCSGNRLDPGKYTLSLITEGMSKTLTIHREGGDVVLTVLSVSQIPASGQNALLVRHGPGPKSHTIEGVYLENIKAVFYLDHSGKVKPLDKMFAGVQRVPIT